MKSLLSWLTVLFMAMFWIFRIAVTVSLQFGGSFGGFLVFNNTFEIIMLFVSMLCFILIVRRNIFGPIIYTVGYGLYFGSYIFSTFVPSLTSGEQIDIVVLQNGFVAILGLVLGLVTLLNIAYEKTKLKHFSDKKTDWYFDNEKYERKLDDRADKNQYRTY